MPLSYEEIRRIFRLEKNTAKLVELDADFYEQLKLFIREEKENCMGSFDNLNKVNSFNNLKKMIYDIYSIREKKLLNLALLSSRTNDINSEHMAREEVDLYKKLTVIMKENRSDVLKIFDEHCYRQDRGASISSAKAEAKTTEIEQDFKEEEVKDFDDNVETIEVIVLTNVPSFIGADMKEYGPFSSQDIVVLPSEIAKLFIARNLAQRK